MSDLDAAPYDASDEVQVGRARKRSETERTRRQAELTWILADERGRRFLWRLLDRAGVFRTSFTGDSATFFNEGMRNVGLIVQSDIMAADPEAYLAMIQENRSPDV